ncbi:uncharacterized protein CG4449 isoform X1 [Monomorium pharaonis]|uniref:uncharacterized protein CG4449 isoform X1 n=1 Tax=Monomorium pharaonis TaxID=307658 RepID=UPI00063F6B92|nr:uncharacterized protein CG4449 isoform X1 [Monomorium pharaonis]XP_036147881.1 uncharacterized protein CG4449 isoform X1 [Monomorium pharaonis]
MNKIMDSSSDEDDPYTNSVARLRALKKQRMEREQFSIENSFSIEQQTKSKAVQNEEVNGKEINGKETSNEEISNKVVCSEEISNEVIYSEEISNEGIQTRSRTVRGRRNKKIPNKGVNWWRTRGRRLPVDLEYNEIEELREKNPIPIIESCEDIIALSDDDAYNEDDNYEINVKVYWRSNRLDRLTMRRHDTFKEIFQYYADLEKVSVNEVLIMKGDKIVNHTDTPAELKLSIIDILDGGIVNPGMNTLSPDKSDENLCTIKVQTANRKQSFTIPLRKDEQFKALFINCAKQLGVNETKLKLYFDGEQISPTDTPESLDLEEEACVDLRISI